MKTISKEQLLNNLERKVELHILKAVEVFQNMNSHELLKPAPDGGWSIAQCLWHLNSYSEYYLPQINKALNENKKVSSDKYFKSGWLGSYFTNLMEPKAGFKKMKAFKNHIPPVDINAHETVSAFIQHQETFLKILQQARQCDINNIRIPISISKFIRLKLGDVLSFMVAHDERHLQQASKLLS